MIDRHLKQGLGQMMHGVHVVGATHDGVARAYTSHWVTQVSFEEPVLMASVSPKHDTYPLMIGSGTFSVSPLAADQVLEAQYFSYPGWKFNQVADEYLTTWSGAAGPELPVVPSSIAWLRCEIFETTPMRDHVLVFAEVSDVVVHRPREAPLLYSSRLGWRSSGVRAREPEMGVRDRLLDRLAGDSDQST